MVMLGTLLFVALFAPLLAPYDPNDVLLGDGVTPRDPPCVHILGCDADQPQHVLGIDGNGRDQFSRILFGARVSLAAGLGAVVFAVVLGALVGLVSGYFGGWLDSVLMRLMDVLLAFPALLLAIFIVTVFGPGLINAIFAIAIVMLARMSRTGGSTRGGGEGLAWLFGRTRVCSSRPRPSSR